MSEFLAEAKVLIRPDVSAFRAELQAELAAATKGIVVPVSVVAAGSGTAAASVASVSTAQKELAASTTLATGATEKQVTVQQLGAAAAEKDAIAQKEDAAATEKNALAHEQLARGVGATTLSLLKVRGATLAASTPFLAGAAAVTVLAKATADAVAEQDAFSRAQVIFGADARKIEEDAKGLADTFGLSATEALNFEGAVGNVLKQAGVTADRIPTLSESLVKLAADMAAFNHVPLDNVLNTLQLSILGNTRGLKALGVELGAADVNARALSLTGKDNIHQLTQQDRVLARLSLLYERTTNQQGAFARQSGNLSEQSAILRANLTNLGDDVGKVLIPELNFLVGTVTELVRGFEKLASLPGKIPVLDEVTGFIGKHKDLEHGIIGSILFPPLAPAIGLITGIKALNGALSDSGDAAKNATSPLDAYRATIAAVNTGLQTITDTFKNLEIVSAQLTFKDASANLANLQEDLVKAQIASADTGAELANLARQEQAARAVVAAATRLSDLSPNDPKLTKQRRQSESTLLAIVQREREIRKQDAQAAVAAAQQIQQIVQDAAQRVKQAIQDADQAFLDAISNQEDAHALAATRAQGTKSLVDDIAAEEAYRAFLVKSIAETRRTVIDAKTRTQEINRLTAELAQTNNAIKANQEQQRLNAQAARQNRFDRAAASIDLDIELAQTEKNIRAEIAARQRRIKLDEEREKAVRGDILATKKLRNDIAAQRAAIADLRKQQNQKNTDLQALELAFLQTQSGFAANLLSNLLPTNAVSGTVAGSTGGGSVVTPTGPSGGGGGGIIDLGPGRPPDVVDVASGLRTDATVAGGSPPVSAGQMSTLIHIQRQTLQVLTRLAGQRTHPEAAATAAAQAVSMDFF